ncbi:MAG TPA: hypothetical protein VHW01_22845, partial [Polyangiaceae bacterium]|nr:hypothetical protein [Polyangiaceae bacterium]
GPSTVHSRKGFKGHVKRLTSVKRVAGAASAIPLETEQFQAFRQHEMRLFATAAWREPCSR